MTHVAPLRKFMIQLMLISLGIGAVAGALAILMAETETVRRVVGTAIATAVAAGLMLPASLLADKPKSRTAGIAAMMLIAFEYLLCMCATWEPLRLLGYSDDWRCLTTMGVLAVVGIPSIIFTRGLEAPISRRACVAGLILSVIVFGLLMGAAWLRGADYQLREQLGESSLAFAGLGVIIVAAMVGQGVSRAWWRWLGISSAALALTMVLGHIWKNTTGPQTPVTVLICLAVAVAHANLAAQCPLSAGQVWLRWTTVSAAVTAAVLFTVTALMHDLDRYADESVASRLTGAIGMIAGCGSLAMLVMAKINRRLDTPAVLSEITVITLVCPGCQKKQVLKLGEPVCPVCGLRFHLAVEEPRCPVCNYVLLMLKSDRCPECGTLISNPADRLGPASI